VSKVSESNTLPELSVIITSFNDGDLLGQLLDNCIKCCSMNVELIVIDDGSTDSTFSVAKDYSQKLSQLRVFRQSNRGLGSARNLGISVMRGRFGVFLDADDLLDIDLVTQQILPVMRAEKLDFALFQTENFTEDESLQMEVARANRYFSKSRAVETLTLRGSELATELEKHNSFSVSAWQFVWDAAFLRERKIWFRRGVLMEDNLFTFLLFTYAKRCRFIPITPHRRAIRRGSITHSSEKCAVFAGYVDAYVQIQRSISREKIGPVDWQQSFLDRIRFHINELRPDVGAKCARDAVRFACPASDNGHIFT